MATSWACCHGFSVLCGLQPYWAMGEGDYSRRVYRDVRRDIRLRRTDKRITTVDETAPAFGFPECPVVMLPFCSPIRGSRVSLSWTGVFGDREMLSLDAAGLMYCHENPQCCDWAFAVFYFSSDSVICSFSGMV